MKRRDLDCYVINAIPQHRYWAGRLVVIIDDQSRNHEQGGELRIAEFICYTKNGSGVNAKVKQRLKKWQYIHPSNIVGLLDGDELVVQRRAA